MRAIVTHSGHCLLLIIALIIASTNSRSAFAQVVANGPRLGGVWKLNPAKSDDVQAKLNRAGQRGGGGGGGGGRGGGIGRSEAIELIRDLVAGDDQLVIAGMLETLTVTSSNGRLTKLATSRKPASFSIGAHSVERTVTSSGDRLIERLELSEWTVTRTFRLTAPEQLEVRLEGRGRGSAPGVELRRTYDLLRK
jgi:hypothetical protein